jgi:hypothetical protein
MYLALVLVQIYSTHQQGSLLSIYISASSSSYFRIHVVRVCVRVYIHTTTTT